MQKPTNQAQNQHSAQEHTHDPMFHTSDGGGFAVAGCTYQMFDPNGNPTGRLSDASSLHIVSINGQHFLLSGLDMARFLYAIGWQGEAQG